MQEQDTSHDPLKNQLSNLDQLFQEFADQFEKAARSLREGYVPDPIPNIQLEAAGKVMEDTLSAIVDAAAPFDLDPLPRDTSLKAAMLYFDDVLAARAEAERQLRLLTEARFVIAEIQTLQHDSDPETLNLVRQNIENAYRRLDDKQFEEAEKLVSGEHPLSMLAAYASHRDTLSDTEYDTFRETIEREFGRSVLRDIDRGRISNPGAPDAAENEVEEEPDSEQAINQLLDEEEILLNESGDVIEENIAYTFEEEIAAAFENELEESIEEEIVDPFEDAEDDIEEPELEVIDSSDAELLENLIDQDKAKNSSFIDAAFFADIEEGEDALWPPLEGDGFSEPKGGTPEASLHEDDEEGEEQD